MKGSIKVLTSVLFACSNGPEPVPPPPVPTQDMCPEGFGPLDPMLLPDGCYKKGLPAADWIRAEEACEQFTSLGVRAHLIVVDREAEHLALSSISKGGDLWIGRMQEDDDRDGFKNINYIDWDPEYWGAGEPNDYGQDCSGFSCTGRAGHGDERCVEYKHETGMWNDEKCGRLDRVICEWDNVEPYGWRPGSQGI